jgi:hypothetical protein
MRFLVAVRLYLTSRLTWRSARRIARGDRIYRIVARDGFLYIEPRRAA